MVEKKSKNKKTALITGVTGQDGSYLAEFLINKGYKVYGFMRRSSTEPLLRIGELVFSKKLKLIYGDLRDIAAIKRAIEESKPDEIYNLAAQSDVGISFKCPEETMEINYYGVGRLVNEAMKFNPKIKIYQASTSEMFGKTPPPQNENSPFDPVSPYGEAKLKAYEDFVVGYRQKHNLFICSGILFNHESPRRGKHFVTRKITHSLSKIKYGLQEFITLGNLEAERDWGYAGDYVEAMWLMMQQDEPDDFVVATGESHSVRELVETAADFLDMKVRWKGRGLDEVGLDGKGKVIVRINKNFYRPYEVNYLQGNISKAKKTLGWKPKVKFRELIKMMVKADSRDVRFEKEFRAFI